MPSSMMVHFRHKHVTVIQAYWLRNCIKQKSTERVGISFIDQNEVDEDLIDGKLDARIADWSGQTKAIWWTIIA